MLLLDEPSVFRLFFASRLARPLGAVVVPVGLLDPAVDEEAEHVRSEVERQDDEVELRHQHQYYYYYYYYYY